jgi:hypothetical protein
MKPVNRRLSDGTIKSILQAERAAALGSEQSSDLSEQRIRALEYYVGDMSSDMPAPDGQSSAVSSDVQDVVEGVLPIIVDVLTGNEKIVEFSPVHDGDEPQAEQETDYVNHVFFQENDGFLTLYTAVKDILLSKNGYIKWWMEPDEARTREQYKGLTEDAFAMLVGDTDVEVVDLEQYQDIDPATQQPANFFNATVETVKTIRKARVAAVPPEEILISKNARDIPNSPYLAHVQRKPLADVIALFPDREAMIRNAPNAVTTSDNHEAEARQTVQDQQDPLQTADDVNTDMRMIEVVEHFIRMALEKDKIARRYKITTIGTASEILDIEEVTAWNIASGTAIKMTHRHFGRSLADLTIDIQQIKTSLLRATLNNAYFANNQRVEVAETHASENTIDDLLNNRVGGIVRTKMPGGLKQLETQPIGGWVAPIIEYMDGVRENRTGSGKNNTGLDIDNMNHARTGAVTRIMDQAEMRIKMMARIIAETLVVDTMRGLHQMLQEYSEEQAVFKIRGGWVTVNPREWKVRSKMTVTLPLGGASKQQLMTFFTQILGVQKEAMVSGGGPNGPLVSWENVYATCEQLTKLAGLKSVSPFFMKPAPPDPKAPPPPDPKMVESQAKAQATQQQTQAAIAADQEKAKSSLMLEQLKLQAARERERDEFAHKQALDKMKFEHDTEMERLKTMAAIERDRMKAENQMQIDRQQATLQAKEGVGDV